MDLHNLENLFISLFKKRRRGTLYLALFLVVLFAVIRFASPSYLVTVPVSGGALSEGMVGYPRFVNPVLALSQTDKDLSRLVFAGLFQTDNSGTIVPDMATSYQFNASSTELTVVLRDDVYFHDGNPVTTADVDFTYSLIQDPVIKSHLSPILEQVNWDILDDQTIKFTTKNPRPGLIEDLTFGILSHEHWNNVSSEEFPFVISNISPIGSGPYALSSINRDNQERISSYVLHAHTTSNRTPYISNLEIVFYETQRLAIQAFEAGLIDNLANISPQELLFLDHTLENKQIQSYPLDRSFALFFNQNTQEIFTDSTVRQAIDQQIDKHRIIKEVLFERGDVATGPLPLSHSFYLPDEEQTAPTKEDLDKALAKMNWTWDEETARYTQASSTLTVTIHVPEVDELIQAATIVAQNLVSIGIDSIVIPVAQDQIIGDVIRERSYELLLFGQLAEDPASLYAFWHSTGIEDPGINIAQYENKTVDAILERLISGKHEDTSIQIDYANLQKEIRQDVPAVFLYHPHFIYAIDQRVNNALLGELRFAWDRFSAINEWYIQTESLLPWFNR